jgi:hypothetical protein
MASVQKLSNTPDCGAIDLFYRKCVVTYVAAARSN